LEQRIAEQSTHQQSLEEKLEGHRNRLRLRLRVLHRMGRYGPLDVLFQSQSVEGGMFAFRMLSYLATADQRLIGQIRSDEQLIETSRAELKKQRAQLGQLRERVSSRREQVKAARQQKERSVEEIRGEASLLAQAVLDLRRAQERLGQVLKTLESQKVDMTGFEKWRGRLPSPVEGAKLETPFGLRRDPRFGTMTRHQGVDLVAPRGTPVKAIYPGKVVFAEMFQGYGLLAIVDHGARYYSLYAHLDRLLVETGKLVVQGQALGMLGDTGSLQGPVLYFEVREGGRAVNPESWVRF
jgi:murein hydrolase activator